MKRKTILNLSIIPITIIMCNVESKLYSVLFASLCVFIIVYINEK